MKETKELKGSLITNGFLHSTKFTEISLWLLESAKKNHINLSHITNDEIPLVITDDSKNKILEDNQFVLFWDKDIRLAKYLELQGHHLFNNAHSIEVCDDKAYTHLKLQFAGVPMPKTIIAPMTFPEIGYTNLLFLDNTIDTLGLPLVVKECFGSFGMQVYLAHTKEELIEIVTRINGKPMLFQEFISTSKGKDIRLQVVGNQVVASMYRYSDNGDFRANITNGGKMKSYEPTQEQIDLALKCCKVIGLDFAGVDILFGKDNKPLVCEVNSNAHFKNIYDCTGVNVADHIMEYIIKKTV